MELETNEWPQPMVQTGRMRWPRAGRWLLPATLVTLLILSLLPFGITLNLALKSVSQYEHERFAVQGPFHWSNFIEAWHGIYQYVFNSLLISGVSAAGVVFLSALGGYAFSRGKFPFKNVIYLGIISGLMIPGILCLVPKFVLYKHFGLINTRWALLISYWTEGQIFGIFLFRSYLESLPSGLYEAAEIDGANLWQVFRHVAMPLSVPIIGTLAVINILFTWNDIVWPWLVITDDKLRTISIGLSLFQNASSENWGPMFAGYIICAIPLILVFTFTSKYFVEGLTSGAFKA